MKSYEAVIWDWNGTLLDDVELCVSIVNEVLGEYGVRPLSTSRYQEIFDFPVRLYWERAGLDLERVDFHDVSARFCGRFEERLHRATLHAGAQRALDSARAVGLTQLLLSNTEQAALSRMVEHYDVSSHFDGVQGMSDTLADGKLSGGRAIVDAFALDPASTLMIGDTTHDAEVARALGVDCVLVAVGHQARSRLAGQGFPVVESFEALSAAAVLR